MERFDAARQTRLAETFGHLVTTVSLAEKQFGDAPISDEVRLQLTNLSIGFVAWLHPLGFNIALASAATMNRLATKPKTTHRDVAKILEEFIGRLHAQLDNALFLFIPSDRSHYFSQPNLFGDEVALRFPTVGDDVEEAGKCLALDRGTACVFHSMRVLEIGLYALAAQLHITPEENWHNAIEQIQAEITRLSKTNPDKNSPWKVVWKARVEFFSDAATHLMFVKGAWRNRTAHAGQIHTVEKARSIFRHTREFMQHLATRLGE